MTRLELHLAKVLRHVPEDYPVSITTLASTVSREQKIKIDAALYYIAQLVDVQYLAIKDNSNVIRGTTQYPPEIVHGGYYVFSSKCWSCEKSIDKKVDIYSSKIYWNCIDCSVSWTEIL